MGEIKWQSLHPLWPPPAVSADLGDLMLLVFTQDGVPTWEVRYRRVVDNENDDLVASGTADTFEAAKSAALLRQQRRPCSRGRMRSSSKDAVCGAQIHN
jgi:hypothetical protein